MNGAAAAGVLQHYGRARIFAEMGVAVLEEGGQHPLQVMCLSRQVVLLAGALPLLLITLAFKEAGVDQLSKAFGQDTPGDPEVVGDLVEAVEPGKDLAQDEQSPSLADQGQGCRDAAVAQIKFLPLHDASILQGCHLELSLDAT